MAHDLDHGDEVLSQALATAGALVALADGRDLERDEFVNFVDRQQMAPVMSRHGRGQIFDNCVRQLEGVSRDCGYFHPLAGQSLASVMLRAADRRPQALDLIRLILMSLPTERPPVVRSRS